MSQNRPERTLREVADFLLDVARLQPRFHQRATQLNAELRRAEQEYQATLQRYTREWEQARKEQEQLRSQLVSMQEALSSAQAELHAARLESQQRADRIKELRPSNVEHAAGVTAEREDEGPKRQLEQLRRKINSPRFWSGAFAETFAESLASMDSIHQALEVDSDAEVTAVFREWQKEIVDGVELFNELEFDQELAEHLRRLLICQWVYLRWLEVTS